MTLTPLERALLGVLRSALAGDEEGVRILAERLLQRLPGGVSAPQLLNNELRRLLVASKDRRAPSRNSTATVPLPMDADSSLPIVVVRPELIIQPPVFNAGNAGEVEAFVREHQETDRLATAGLAPARTLLLLGPPGVGKTMTARYVAASLELPLVSLDLVTVMSSYLGRTGQNLRGALDYARTTRCVLFLDEFDALAKRRDDMQDIGELKRLVNVLLLELEHWPSESILVAATNYPELLDRAVERRFDTIIRLGRPVPETRLAILLSNLTAAGRAADPDLLWACAVATDGWSGSDLARLSRLVLRREVIERVPLGTAMAQEVARAIGPRISGEHADEEVRAAFCTIAVAHGGLTHQDVAQMLGVSLPTVARLLHAWNRRAEADEDQ